MPSPLLTVTLGTDITDVEEITGGGAGFTLANGTAWAIGAGVDDQADDGTVDGIDFIETSSTLRISPVPRVWIRSRCREAR